MANKRYDQYDPGTPTASRIILHADPSDGELARCPISDITSLASSLSNEIAAYQALGSQIKASSLFMYPTQLFAQSNMADANQKIIAVYLPTDVTITGVWFMLSQSGNYTADQNNKVALYSYSGGTLTRVAQSTNNGNVWKGSTGVVLKEPFTGTYAATKGLYFLSMLYNNSAQVTAPALLSINSVASSAFQTMDFTNSALLQGNKSATSDMGSSLAISAFSSTTTWVWAGLY